MKKIHVIGDSISMHYGPYLEKALGSGYAYSRKEGKYESLDVPAGANGGDSSQVLQYLEWLQEQRFHTDILVVNCGLHDIKQEPLSGKLQIAIDRYAENMRKIVALAGVISGTMVWVTTTPVNDETHKKHVKDFFRQNANVNAYNSVALEVVNKHKITTIDLNGFTAQLSCPLYCDHVHFTEFVREKQAEFIASAIQRIA